MASLARRYGLWSAEKIYDHPANAELKQRRKSPYIMHPGDEVVIPDAERREFAIATGARHAFRAGHRRVPFQLIVRDGLGNALSKKRYCLNVEGSEFRGRITTKGLIKREIPTSAESGKLTVWPFDEIDDDTIHWGVRIGHLDPISEISGVKARLHNLGFVCGEVDSILDDITESAIRAFQVRARLHPTGELDDATRRHLEEAHENT